MIRRKLRALIERTAHQLLSDKNKARLLDSAIRLIGASEVESTARTHQMASMEASLRRLRRLGFSPDAILDVGAYVGDWTRLAKSIWPNAHVLMLDAQSDKAPQLAAVAESLVPQVEFEIALLGSSMRENVVFYELESGSSVFIEESSVPRKVVNRPMTTLDQVLSRRARATWPLVKLDVQGFEIEVLKGGRTVLESSEVVVLEVSLLPVHRDAPLLHDVVVYMKDHGFVAYDISSLICRPLDLALWQIDVVFVRESSNLRSDTRFDEPATQTPCMSSNY